jgi:FkbM family methyltransferase
VEFDPFPWLRGAYRIHTLIDIGANNGDYGAFLARFFGVQEAYFFEPLASCQAQLQAVARRIPSVQVLPFALSDETGEATFFRTEYAPSSSLLPPDSSAVSEFPQNAVRESGQIPLRQLDDVLRDRPLVEDVLIKIDVQGVEDKVIRGGRRTFGRAKVVLIEMSFVPFYDGQPLFEDVHDMLVEAGLRFAGIKNQIMMPKSGRPGFAHCVYIRS